MPSAVSSPSASTPSVANVERFALWVLVPAALLWSYWPTLLSLMRDWKSDEDYSIGQLVPFAAAYMIWNKRRELRPIAMTTCWWGAVVMLAGQAMRAYGLLFLFDSAERYSLIVSVAGAALFLFGFPLTRRIGWVIAFLALMIPLPGRVHNLIAGPLQTFATTGAVFLLELFGTTVTRDGHTITLNGTTPLAVAEACSGLRMLTAFVVVGGVMASVIGRPIIQKCFVVASTVPVAIVCNLIRLVATAYLFMLVDGKTAEKFFHDFAGWFMMPLAVACLVCELWVLDKVFESERSASQAS